MFINISGNNVLRSGFTNICNKPLTILATTLRSPSYCTFIGNPADYTGVLLRRYISFIMTSKSVNIKKIQPHDGSQTCQHVKTALCRFVYPLLCNWLSAIAKLISIGTQAGLTTSPSKVSSFAESSSGRLNRDAVHRPAHSAASSLFHCMRSPTQLNCIYSNHG